MPILQNHRIFQTWIRYTFILVIAIGSLCSCLNFSFANGEDDEYEENDDFSSAALLPMGKISALRLTPLDQHDFFKILLTEKQLYQFSIQETQPAEKKDLKIFLYDEELNYLDSEILSSYEPNETLFLYSSSNSYVYIEVQYFSSKNLTEFIEYEILSEVQNPEVDSYYSHGLQIGQEYQYESSQNLNLDASQQYFDSMTPYLLSNYTTSENNSIFSPEFQFRQFVDDYLAYLSTNFSLSFVPSDIHGVSMEGIDQSNYLETVDLIKGKTRLNFNQTSWGLPSEYELLKLQQLQTIVDSFFDDNYIEDSITPSLAKLSDEITNRNATFYDSLVFQTHLKTYEPILETFNFEGVELKNGSKLRNPPIDYYLPAFFSSSSIDNILEQLSEQDFNPLLGFKTNIGNLLQLNFPQDFNFQEYFEWFGDGAEFFQAYYKEPGNEIEGESPLALVGAVLSENFALSSLYVGNRSIGISGYLDGYQFDDLEQILSLIPMLSLDNDIEFLVNETVLLAGIDFSSVSGKLTIGIEYDEDMVLATSSIYFEISGISDLSKIDPSQDLNELLTFTGQSTIKRTEFTLPSIEQIEQGELGETRDMYDRSIPEKIIARIFPYKMEIIGIVSVISMLLSFKFFKKQNN